MMGYYSGDPGFFSILKNIGSAAVGMIPGVGGVAGKLISKIPTGIRGGAAQMTKAASMAIVKHPVISAAAGGGGLANGGASARRAGGFGGAAGQHPSPPPLRALAVGLKRG